MDKIHLYILCIKFIFGLVYDPSNLTHTDKLMIFFFIRNNSENSIPLSLITYHHKKPNKGSPKILQYLLRIFILLLIERIY